MSRRAIPQPKSAPSAPDADTRKGLSDDMTGAEARERVFYVNLGFLRYGTDDKTHAAAVIFASVLLLAVNVVIFAQFIAPEGNGDWAERALTWLGNAFLFIVGVAIGKGGSDDRSRSGS